MESVVLIIHLVLALAIIALVLLQRSEGGGLGIGGGGMGALASARTAAGALQRMTAFLAAGFFATSLILGILAGTHHKTGSIIDALDEQPAAAEAPVALPSDESPAPAAADAATETAPTAAPEPSKPSVPTSD